MKLKGSTMKLKGSAMKLKGSAMKLKGSTMKLKGSTVKLELSNVWVVEDFPVKLLCDRHCYSIDIFSYRIITVTFGRNYSIL